MVNRACTSARFWGLPSEARYELRARSEKVARMLSIPDIRYADLIPEATAIGREPGIDRSDPIRELENDETQGQSGSENEGAGTDGAQEEQATWMPLVAAWGQYMIHASFDAWWEKNRRKARARDPVAAELAEIGQRRGETVVGMSETLRRWLQGVAGPSELNPEAATKWLGVWNQLEAGRRASNMPSRHAGPTVERPGLARQHAVGRAVHRRRGRTEQAKLPDGTILSNPYEIARARMSTRDHIWFRHPPARHGSKEGHPDPLRGGTTAQHPGKPAA